MRTTPTPAWTTGSMCLAMKVVIYASPFAFFFNHLSLDLSADGAVDSFYFVPSMIFRPKEKIMLPSSLPSLSAMRDFWVSAVEGGYGSTNIQLTFQVSAANSLDQNLQTNQFV